MSRKIQGDVVATMMLPAFRWAEFSEALDETRFILDPVGEDLDGLVESESDPEYRAELRDSIATLDRVYELIGQLRDEIEKQTGIGEA